jgi:hypothetical protein
MRRELAASTDNVARRTGLFVRFKFTLIAATPSLHFERLRTPQHTRQ